MQFECELKKFTRAISALLMVEYGWKSHRPGVMLIACY